MKPLSIAEYIKAPCRASSIPFWKQKNLVLPDGMKIVHDDDFSAEEFFGYKDEKYFRLYHDLKKVNRSDNENIGIIRVDKDNLDILVDIINASYCDIKVTKTQMEGYFKTPVYNEDLWILLKDKNSGGYIGGGIADYDKQTGELILEWIQVLPQYRRRGYGQIIVNYLLSEMRGTAKFATVSGKLDNPDKPEKLYRKCGFTGNDIWHIFKKDPKAADGHKMCFVAVEFVDDINVVGYTYWYLCPYESVRVGDKVVAPLGRHNREQTGVVRKVLFADEAGAPFPLSYIKKIRKIV